jgi:hypothetical protein
MIRRITPCRNGLTPTAANVSPGLQSRVTLTSKPVYPPPAAPMIRSGDYAETEDEVCFALD